MARKLTSKQRKAHKRASYIRSEYYKNFDALDYLRNFGKVKDVKIPNKITKASLKAIRKAYKEAKANLPKTDGFYVDYSTGEILTKLPTKEEMARETRTSYGQDYRQYRAQPEEAPASFDPSQQYIDELKEKIRTMGYAEQIVGYNKKKKETFDAKTLPKFEKAKQDWEHMIDLAVEKFGVERAAEVLAESPHVQKIEDTQITKYAFEITEEINDAVLPWMTASIAYEVSRL